MDDADYRFLRNTAIVLTLAWVGWSFYDGFLRDSGPGLTAYQAANRYFEDGKFDKALQEYQNALQADPSNLHALRGKARSLLQLERYDEALAAFDEAIASEPDFAASYANRGILFDRMADYRRAIQDYEQALRLDPEIAEGPNWLTRFLRLQTEKPPTIADRLAYLKQQMALPESRRVLRKPEEDARQRSYKM
jgi:tetratricopeptide (TPR) repeat protein